MPQSGYTGSGSAERLRAAFRAGRTRPLEWRIKQLRCLEAMLVEQEGPLIKALAADVAKPEIEGWASELASTMGEVRLARRKLKSWAKDRRLAIPASHRPGRAWVHSEPLGVALIIGPWNFPIQLLLSPLAGAIAAGNCAVIKPSELAPETSAALAQFLPQYLDDSAFEVVEGGVEASTDLLAQKWDHIFYTGNGVVGRIVAQAAARNLTPTTLELGGKSPVVVASDADLRVAARRIAWGRFFNAGQVCMAPDYVLVESSVRKNFVEEVARAVATFYGADPTRSPDFGRIVNQHHFERVTGLIDAGGYERLAMGGQRDAVTRYIAPTVLDGVDDGAPVMAEEIFGPVLPIRPVRDVREAVEYVNARPKPLAAYVFTSSRDTARLVERRTSSGALGVNNVVLHATAPHLPFGGVGESGMGSYHGRWGFDTFSHQKAVLTKSTRLDVPLAYPPYTERKSRLVRRLL
ncbi:aldehyde dehydrogenase family protein [Streptomyces sp. NPDC048479]|uniref:aldehyde dehydrogenase family protein n=1 Tax=Streptomyces sp. NPDC048479 TaxID=3154725 RepID=UPI003419570B